MKTIQMTIDDELLAEVDRATEALHTNRSAFIRSALQLALRQHEIRQLEQQHAAGYTNQPIMPDEFDVWEARAAVERTMKHGDVYWYEFQPPDKRRMVVILTRTSATSFLSSITIAPITSTIRGIPTEVILTPAEGFATDCAINLDNIQTVPKAKLRAYQSHLSPAKIRMLHVAIHFALGFDISE